MKKIKFIALALIFACACFVSCEDPDPDPNPNGGGTEQEGENGGGTDQNAVDLTEVDFMQHVWTVTKVSCPDISKELEAKLNGAMSRNSLIFDNFGITGAKDYEGWGMNLSINMQSQFAFFVKYYRLTGTAKQQLSFTAGTTVYTGELVMSQNDKNIYASFTGKSADGSDVTTFECYLAKK